MMKARLLSIMLSILIACQSPKEDTTKADDVEPFIAASLHEIINNPNDFNGKQIQTTGIFTYKFENVALYKSRSAARNNETGEVLWLEFNDFLNIWEEDLVDLNNRKITVKGTLNISDKGHLSQFAGTILKITHIQD